MKTGISVSLQNKGFLNWGDDRYKKLKEFGFSCADFDMSNTSTVIYTADDEELKALMAKERQLAEDAGIEINQVHGPWRWPAQDTTPEDRAERMEKMKKSIYTTHLLGCENWIIHPIVPFGINEKGTELAQKTWDLNIEFMSELLKYAKEYDITICYENMPMPEFSLGSPEEILSFVKAMNDENFKICLDTGHVSVYQDKLKMGEEVRRLGKEIRTLHVHDNRVGFDLHLLPFTGDINWTEFAEAMKDIGFDGVISLETVPSIKFGDDIFEDMFRIYARIACKIADMIEG